MKRLLESKILIVLLCISMTVPVNASQTGFIISPEDEGSVSLDISSRDEEVLSFPDSSFIEGTADDLPEQPLIEGTADDSHTLSFIEESSDESAAMPYDYDSYTDHSEAEESYEYVDPDHISEEDIERFKADGTWENQLEAMEELAGQQDRLQQTLIGNLAKYDPRNSAGITPDGAKMPVTGLYGNPMPAEGYVKPIVFTAEFKDMKMPASYKNNLKNRLFSKDTTYKKWPYESLTSYYYKSSGGLLTIDGDIYNYSTSNDRAHYNNEDVKTRNHDLYDEIFTDWIDSLKAEAQKEGCSLSDKLAPYDSDGDKILDGIYIIYAGPKGKWATQWWSYRTNFSYDFEDTGYKCTQLVFMNNRDYNLDSCTNTFIHETGHMLGLVDLYYYRTPRVDKFSSFDMMNNKIGDINGFSKLLLGWLPENRVKIITSDRKISLNPYGGKNGDIAIIIPKDEYEQYGLYSEFIMAEYYQGVGNDLIPKIYNAKNGVRLFHVYARLNSKGTNFAANNNYSNYIPLFTAMDKDHEKDNGKHTDYADKTDYTNCLYYKGNEFGPWTTPGSSFYSDNSNNRGSYSRASLKFSGIYINNINPGKTNCTMNVRFLTQDMIEKNANFRKKADLNITGQSVSAVDKGGCRTFTLKFNQEVSLIPGKNINVYDAVNNRFLFNFDSKSFGLIPYGMNYSYSRCNAYLRIKDSYIKDKYLKIVIPKGTFRSSLDRENSAYQAFFNCTGNNTQPGSGNKNRLKTAVLPAADALPDEFDAPYSWDCTLDDEGNGLLALMQPDEDDRSLDIYDVEYGEFTGSEMHLSPRYSDEYDDYDAEITQLCSIGEDRYLMVIGNLYKAFTDDDLYDESTYYALITLDSGEIENERIIKVDDACCTGFVDGKFAVAVGEESGTGQTMCLYDPADESGDIDYEINAGLSNEDFFIGGGDGSIKKLGDNIAISPDGYAWVVLTPGNSRTITGYRYFTDDADAVPTAIEYLNGRYYVVTCSDVNRDSEESGSFVEADPDPYDTPGYLDESEYGPEDEDEEDDDPQYGCRLSVYDSIDSADPVNSVSLFSGADELCLSDYGVLLYIKDQGGSIMDTDLNSSEELYDLNIHNAFKTADGGFFVTVDASPETPYDEGEDIFDTTEDDEEVESDELQIYLLYPPYNDAIPLTPPEIITETVNRGTEGSEYYTRLEAISTTPVKWSVSGNALPEGLVLDEDSGEITGIPENEGDVTVPICASNRAGNDTKEITFIIEKEPTYITITGIQPHAEYTGKSITFPDCEVSYKGRVLKAGTDYSIKYSNNINCGEAVACVTLKNGLAGSVEQRFTIYPVNIGKDEFTADDICIKYKKNKTFKPSPVLKWNGKNLKAGRDYTIEGAEVRKEPGTYIITLKGINNYEGERQLNFSLTDNVLMKDTSVKKIAPQSYSGKEIRPASEIEVTYKGKKVPSTAYTLLYENNVSPGKATVIVKGTGRIADGLGVGFEGTKKIEFTIEGKDISKALKTLKIPDREYTGSENEPVTVELLENLSIDLEENTDYELEYLNNTGVGRATAVFTGVGKYKGTVKKTFNIKKYKLHNGDGRMTLSVNSTEYLKGGAVCDPVIEIDGRRLKEGVDYKLSFSSNKKAGQKGSVTVKGTGNFRGCVKTDFGIDTKALNKTVCFAEDVKYVEGKSAKSYFVKPVLTDTNGKKLAAGSDYSKDYIYKYGSDTVLADGRPVKAGESVDPKDIPMAGTSILVIVNAYGNNYTGTTETEYRIVEKLIKNNKFEIVGNFYYNGEQIRPSLGDISCDVPEGSYEILGYGTNVKTGKGMVLLHGMGSYGGTKEVTFSIRNRDIKNSNTE